MVALISTVVDCGRSCRGSLSASGYPGSFCTIATQSIVLKEVSESLCLSYLQHNGTAHHRAWTVLWSPQYDKSPYYPGCHCRDHVPSWRFQRMSSSLRGKSGRAPISDSRVSLAFSVSRRLSYSDATSRCFPALGAYISMSTL
jgi:hypothetical protein